MDRKCKEESDIKEKTTENTQRTKKGKERKG